MPHELFPPGGEECLAEMASRLSDRALKSTLSPLLAELAEVIPLQAALRLSERYGGTRLYIPVVPAPESDLVAQVGHSVARALSRRYGGEALEVPRSAALKRLLRNDQLRRHRATGESLAKLARAFGLTVRQVRNILAQGAYKTT